MHITPHFTFEEISRSGTAARHGIDNTPGPEVVERIRYMLQAGPEILRVYLGRPIYPSSVYRCPEVNAIVGGKKTSQHMMGEAIDFGISGMEPIEVIRLIFALGLPYDQLILEFGRWVHWSITKGYNRGEYFELYHENGIVKKRDIEV